MGERRSLGACESRSEKQKTGLVNQQVIKRHSSAVWTTKKAEFRQFGSPPPFFKKKCTFHFENVYFSFWRLYFSHPLIYFINSQIVFVLIISDRETIPLCLRSGNISCRLSQYRLFRCGQWLSSSRSYVWEFLPSFCRFVCVNASCWHIQRNVVIWHHIFIWIIWWIIRRVCCFYRHACQSVAAKERATSNACDAVRDGDARQSVAATERATSNARDAVRDGDACQAVAVKERIFFNARDAVRDGDACQAAAEIERIISNACDAVRDGNACQSCAVTERIFSNACYAIANCDACQSCAVIVFANRFISEIYFLNGRKVMTQIL